jgi:predicted metal-dependent peptidase
VAVDTSGSITAEQLESFAAEISVLAGLCSELLLLSCDAKVHETIQLGEFSSRLRSLRMTGGGGTDFRPVFDHLRATRHRPDALIYMTDGDGIYPDRAPRDYPVLWCISGVGKPPWGASLLMPA